MALRIKAKVGDIFQIPLDDTRVGYGQVVMQPQNGVLFVCVFSATEGRSEAIDVPAVISSKILLAGNTFDAKIAHGHWPVVANVQPDLHNITLPNYKEGLPGQAFVESWDQKRRRPATPEEEQILTFRGYFAPIRFEKALKALMGLAEWSPDYDELKYDCIQRSSRVKV